MLSSSLHTSKQCLQSNVEFSFSWEISKLQILINPLEYPTATKAKWKITLGVRRIYLLRMNNNMLLLSAFIAITFHVFAGITWHIHDTQNMLREVHRNVCWDFPWFFCSSCSLKIMKVCWNIYFLKRHPATPGSWLCRNKKFWKKRNVAWVKGEVLKRQKVWFVTILFI